MAACGSFLSSAYLPNLTQAHTHGCTAQHTHSYTQIHTHTYGLPWQNGRLAGAERFRQQGSRLMRWKQSLTSISIAEKFHHSRQIESYEVKICYKLCGVASLLKAQWTIFIVPITLPQSELLVRHNHHVSCCYFCFGYQSTNIWPISTPEYTNSLPEQKYLSRKILQYK